MDIYALLERAILNREQVVAMYEGEAREFCPHALGKKADVRHVLAYQFGGSSRTGLPPQGDWRCFTVELLENAATRPGPWHTAPNVFNPQSCLDEIDVVVQPSPPRPARSTDE